MGEWIRAILDVLLILMVGGGVVQATRLIRHLTGLKQGQIEMERFVREFSATVARAENGIKGLRQAARESGDDLEKLVEKAVLMRDELQLIVGSADQLAERLSLVASEALRSESKTPEAKATVGVVNDAVDKPRDVSSPSLPGRKPDAAAPASRAEKELLQALKKLN